jgi:L-asparaginase
LTTLDIPRMTLFSLGGTIASTSDSGAAGAGVVPRLSSADLIAAVPKLGELGSIEAVSFRQCASGDLTLHDVMDLSRAIDERLRRGTSGVVVTQGTDTIEESAFALSLLVSTDDPVVVTGAMRSPTVAGADGPGNLLAAAQVAVAPASRNQGTVVVVNDEIHDPRFVRKTHTSSLSAFRSPLLGPVGWITEGKPRFLSKIRPQVPINFDRIPELPSVALLAISLGDDERLVQAVADMGFQGLVVEALGGGHVPARLVKTLQRLADRIPVILCSRTDCGEVLTATYGFPGSESDLLGKGLISGGMLDGRKMKVLLTLLLAAGFKGQELVVELARRSSADPF